MAEFKKRDLGWKKIRANLSTLDGSYTTVGFHKGPVHDKVKDGKKTVTVAAGSQEWNDLPDVATVAAWMVFGTVHIQRRDFMGEAMERYRADLEGMKKNLLHMMYKGEISPRRALAMLGQRHEDQIKRTLTVGPWAPLAPSTVAAKHSSIPLINTGQMRQGVRHVEVIGGEHQGHEEHHGE